MFKYVSPKLYNKYKQQIFEMGLMFQECTGNTVLRETNSLTDQEIADKLGLDVNDVENIRCIAEVDCLPYNIWTESAEGVEEKARKPFAK